MLKVRIILRNMAVIVACFAVLTITGSCEKEDVYNGVELKLLDIVKSGLYSKRKFIYDDQHRIKEMHTFSDEVLLYKTILTYTAEDLTKCEYVYFEEGEVIDVSTTNYVKNGNTISWSSDVFIIDGEEKESASIQHIFTLNTDGFPDKLEYILLNTNSIINYTYVNGNLTKHLYVSNIDGTLETRETNYTYDAYNYSAYSGCNTPKWFMFLIFFGQASYNTMTRSNYYETVDPMGFKGGYSKTYDYIYDKDGFPTKCTEKYDHGVQEITEFKYKN